MGTNEEYNSLVNQKESKQRQYNATQDRIEECDYLLRRLKKAKETLSSQKSTFRKIKRADQDLVDKGYDWTGSTHSAFLSKGGSMEQEDEYYLGHSLDYVLDSLNNEITRIENKRNREYGILGELASAINWLGNKIENFFN